MRGRTGRLESLQWYFLYFRKRSAPRTGCPSCIWQAVLTVINFLDMNSWYQQLHFLISRIQLLISLVKISIIKSSLVEMSILDINNSIATSNILYFWYLKMYFWYQYYFRYMASRFSFYSFLGYEFLISTITFFDIKNLIVDINN